MRISIYLVFSFIFFSLSCCFQVILYGLCQRLNKIPLNIHNWRNNLNMPTTQSKKATSCLDGINAISCKKKCGGKKSLNSSIGYTISLNKFNPPCVRLIFAHRYSKASERLVMLSLTGTIVAIVISILTELAKNGFQFR